jgi:hypothetical protein
MRTWFVLGSAFTLAMGLMGACGGTSDSNPADAGAADATLDSVAPPSDATTDAPKDASVDSAKCDLSEDFSTKIPDASLDETGTRSTGLCIACLKQPTTCQADITACNADCDCKALIGDVISCVGKGGNPFQCGAGLIAAPAKAREIGLSLLQCAQKKCPEQCSTDLVDASLPDTGTD